MAITLSSSRRAQVSAAQRQRRVHYGFKPREKGAILATKLSDEDNAAMENDIKKKIFTNGLVPPDTHYQYRVMEQLRGSTDGSNKTMHQYPKYWCELGRFAWLVGDIDTAVICCDKLQPKNPLPANPETIAMFYQYKAFEKNLCVKNFDDKTMKYKNGAKKGMTIVGSKEFEGNGRKKGGGWNDPTNIR